MLTVMSVLCCRYVSFFEVSLYITFVFKVAIKVILKFTNEKQENKKTK